LCEQQAIAEVLSDLDKEITALVKQREKTALIKIGMMQNLLTGKVRL
jgi:type I restriction enzyme S subunit